jgi:hypothetical protein
MQKMRGFLGFLWRGFGDMGKKPRETLKKHGAKNYVTLR